MNPIHIGVVSDTHSLLRPAAALALEGCDLILHAGDVGSSDVIEQLEAIAPVHAVRGNIDAGGPCSALPETLLVEVGGRRLLVLHNLDHLGARTGDVDAVISGHTHRPLAERRDGVLYLNPGSIGPRRFKLPISMAKLRVQADGMEVEWLELEASTG